MCVPKTSSRWNPNPPVPEQGRARASSCSADWRLEITSHSRRTPSSISSDLIFGTHSWTKIAVRRLSAEPCPDTYALARSAVAGVSRSPPRAAQSASSEYDTHAGHQPTFGGATDPCSSDACPHSSSGYYGADWLRLRSATLGLVSSTAAGHWRPSASSLGLAESRAACWNYGSGSTYVSAVVKQPQA
jgi:hypothetical protein